LFHVLAVGQSDQTIECC